ncbi:MAG: TonB-dependent receptor [Pseudomonadales bacterium]|nr:TonB-dependent receptor [Pseudomonadales bacterium]
MSPRRHVGRSVAERAAPKALAVAIACLTGSLAAPGAIAEEAAKSGRRIEEVIVTAERREASIQDTSISITALTGDFMDDFGIRNQEDLQNFVPATTIQPYDATVRGVGRNFRALGGDPGVATYMNGVYSEDLLTATAATFFDVARVEVLRGPQGTLYGRNAVGGAINILYNEPTDEFEAIAKTIVGTYGTKEAYLAVSGPIIADKLALRYTGAYRDRDGVVDEISGLGGDLDGLGTENNALQLRWNISDDLELAVRTNRMNIDRSFGGSNGGGLVVLNEGGLPQRDTENLIPGYRAIDTTQTANPLLSNFYDASKPILNFTDPNTGAAVQAQHNRAGIDFMDADGFFNAAASLSGFNNTNAADAARYNACVFPGDIDGGDLCAATNGLNREEFDQKGTQATLTWTASDALEIKYIYGRNKLLYERTTDDDNTGSQFHDRQFYVNHEADYTSHEMQFFFDLSDSFTTTTGIFWYDATIDQRGDFYSTLDDSRYRDPYIDTTGLSALLGGAQVGLFSARDACHTGSLVAESCQRNYSRDNSNEQLALNGTGLRSDNLVAGPWLGDPGGVQLNHGPDSPGSDLLYATKTERKAFAAYTQWAWDINEDFTLTTGLRYASDELTAEENLFRYTESTLTGDLFNPFNAFNLGPIIGDVIGVPGLTLPGLPADVAALDASPVAKFNLANGGLIDNGDGTYTATDRLVAGGVPLAVSVYRPFVRQDKEWTWRINLDWNITPDNMVYFGVTTGTRSGGYNLVFFSNTAAYDPEQITNYELGYKTQWLDGALQVNGSFYYYDYGPIHTVASEIAAIGGATTSVVEAPGAEIFGAEGDILWLATDNLTLGGNFSYTPSEYTEDLFVADPSRAEIPESLFPNQIETLEENIKGNQLLQVPELKWTGYASYMVPMGNNGSLELFANYSWIDDVYYSPFERKEEMAEAYGRVDLRATWRSNGGAWIVTGFANNVLDEVGVLQVLREGEAEFFRHTAGTTLPRLMGLEVTYNMGGARN